MTNEFSSCTYDQSTWGVSQNIMKYTGYGIHARFQKNFSGGGGVQIPRKGLTENFNMAKTNNLASPGGSGPPVSPSGSAHGITVTISLGPMFIGPVYMMVSMLTNLRFCT